MPQGPGYIYHVLDVLMPQRPDLFHEELRITPQTFQKILSEIIDDPIYFQTSRTMNRGRGNAVSQQKVARWADAEKGLIGDL
ncbi:hypothetical protein AZE42_11866 [Rhizopogon vesiculosus]|uniref:Uncharacterized protein n=1 Tax=Rhizopogon vesiculosus TaxID=180088 RepID=A0A1J8RGC2_9AGAM|nr:hypothetical protein AZE42_11866 [Rhizopogon vesiculosus]